MLIRRAVRADEAPIRAVHTAAFAQPGLTKVPEAVLVDELRADGDLIPELSLVAERGGQVIGHVCSSPGKLSEDPSRAVGLGPLGVLPEFQRSGAGSALVHTTLGAADALGFALVVLLGDPGYYHRFGFVLAERLGITPPVAEWKRHFQARALTAHKPENRGAFRYAPAFDRL
ncbi:N-acetyltransferase [Amycolatopsis carbonis]|uniref:N-acetyltransferase n=1 Tax=Amycolatopsis carbonis TaxID=715471 RepID=A0A9Y2IL40_9PSEU|nr:N-acetyltransferase [Amycolatopsis sp. 2-15]WIX82102.1 N-acetyltransferase [Amycolatopsis sp. 2-15]